MQVPVRGGPSFFFSYDLFVCKVDLLRFLLRVFSSPHSIDCGMSAPYRFPPRAGNTLKWSRVDWLPLDIRLFQCVVNLCVDRCGSTRRGRDSSLRLSTAAREVILHPRVRAYYLDARQGPGGTHSFQHHRFFPAVLYLSVRNLSSTCIP